MGPRDDLRGGRTGVKRIGTLRRQAAEEIGVRLVHQPVAGVEQSPVAFREISDHVLGVVLGVVGMDHAT